jgi:hypothetical protein
MTERMSDRSRARRHPFGRRRSLAVALVALALLVSVPAASGAQARRAAQNAAPDTAPGANGAPGVSQGELQRLFDAYVLMQAQETLQLTDAQYPRFLARLRALQEVRRRTLAERTRIVQELRRMVQGRGEGADAGRLSERLKALREAEARAGVVIREAADSLDEVLDPLQQARWRILEEQMERRKLDLLMRARQNNRAARGLR